MVLDVHPGAPLPPVSVQGQWLALERVGHEERDQLLGVLEGPERIGAARDERIDSERSHVRQHLQVGPGLRGRVGAGRQERVVLVGNPTFGVSP